MTDKPPAGARVIHALFGTGTVRSYTLPERTPRVYRRGYCRVAFDAREGSQWVPYLNLAYEDT